MKRSKMIEILQNSFINGMNDPDIGSDHEMYSRVLHDLEGEGMLPPTYDTKDPTDHQRMFSRDSNWNYLGTENGKRMYTLTIYGEWENEDENN